MTEIEEAVKVTMEIYERLAKQISPHNSIFPIIFSEACTTYRSLLIEKRRAEEHNHKEPITEKQKEYIMKLAERYNIDTQTLTEFCKSKGKEAVADLSKSEASELIEKLKGMIK